jgi:hypothetical protein
MDKQNHLHAAFDPQAGSPLESMLGIDHPLMGRPYQPKSASNLGVSGLLEVPLEVSLADVNYFNPVIGSVIPDSISPIVWAQTNWSGDLALPSMGSTLPLGGFDPEDILTNPGLAMALPKEIVFIDAGVEDYQQILKSVNPWAEVVILQTDRDGVSQISDVLSHRDDLSAIHIFSHGNAADLRLGNTSLTNGNLADYATQIQSWKSALNDSADILLYGCDVAAGITGQEFVGQLSRWTGADVAASDNLTGASILGGDWLLEYTTGTIDIQSIQGNYDHVLSPFA